MSKRRVKRRIRWGRLIGLSALAVAVLAVLIVGIVTLRMMASLPSVANLANLPYESSVVYDRYGQQVAVIGSHNSIPVPLKDVPLSLQNAVVAVEDHNFYQNSGVDFRSIARAALVDLLHHGSAVQGASTITEQLAKVRYLTDNRSLSYKVEEVLLGLKIARTYSKSEILDMYLNSVYLGEGAFGVDAAARVYFGTSARNLTLPQAAMIAGLPQAPSYYDPFVNYQAAKTRQQVVLQQMAKYGYITQQQANAAYKAPLNLQPTSLRGTYNDPWFVDTVIELLRQHIPASELYNGGLKIYTTLDPAVQADAQNAIAKVMNPVFGTPSPTSNPNREAAAEVMNPRNGQVLAIVGGRTHPVILGFNRATQGYRQTGSAIKPLAEYSTAISSGWTAASVLDDGPWYFVNGHPWPHNDDFIYRGRIMLTQALAISDNNIAVRLLSQVGIHKAFEFVTQKMGLPLIASGTSNDQTLAMGIGGLTRGVPLWNMVDAYATFANHGMRPLPVIVTRVVNPNDQVIFRQSTHYVRVLSAQQAYIMTYMLQHVLSEGTGVGLGIGRPVAGKTGTSSLGRDGWFMGYTPQLVTGVWEGRDDGATQPGVFGATYAGPIWKYTMEAALAGHPVENFTKPPHIVNVNIDTKSGLLQSPLTPKADIKTMPFILGTQPTKISSVWVQATIDPNAADTLWTPACLPDLPETKTFLKRPTDIVIRPGLQLPIDSVLWVPTTYCNGSTAPPPQSATGSGAGNGSGGSQNPGGQGSGQTTTTALNVNITAQGFQPASLTAPSGATVVLTVTNQDTGPHLFDLPTFGINNVPIGPGATQTFSFVPGSPGQYPFALSDQPSVSGILTVSPPGSQGTGQAPPATGTSTPPGSGNPPPTHGASHG